MEPGKPYRVSPTTSAWGASMCSLSEVVWSVNGCGVVPEPLVGPSGAPVRAPGARRRFWRHHGSICECTRLPQRGQDACHREGLLCGLDGREPDFLLRSRSRRQSTAPRICCPRDQSIPPTRFRTPRSQCISGLRPPTPNFKDAVIVPISSSTGDRQGDEPYRIKNSRSPPLA